MTVEECLAIAIEEAMTFRYDDKKYKAAEMLEAIKATGDGDLAYEFQLAVLFGTKVISGINAE